MTRSRLNILVTSAGRRIQLIDGLRAALNRAGVEGAVLVAEASAEAPACFWADEAYLVPPTSSPGYVEALLRLCDERDVGLVVPTIDPELGPLARARERFADNEVLVSVSQLPTIVISSNKRATHRWLSSFGAPTVHQWEPSEISADTFSEHERLLVKPRSGSMSKGVRIVRALSELDPSEDVVVETIAEGSEYTTSTFVARNGRCLAVVPRERIEVRGGEVSKGRTRRMPELEELVRRIVEGLPGAFGPINVQAFCDGEGSISVIEINSRFGGGDPLAWTAGADFPYALVLEALDLDTDPDDFRWAEEVLMLRFDRAVYRRPDGSSDVG